MNHPLCWMPAAISLTSCGVAKTLLDLGGSEGFCAGIPGKMPKALIDPAFLKALLAGDLALRRPWAVPECLPTGDSVRRAQAAAASSRVSGYSHRSPRLKVIASRGRMLTGSSSFAVAMSAHSRSRSSKASRGALRQVHEPQVAHPFAGIESTAVGEFPSVLLSGEHLAHPVRPER